MSTAGSLLCSQSCTEQGLECSKHSAHVCDVAEQRQASHVINLYKRRSEL